jgi:hypothetical protein
MKTKKLPHVEVCREEFIRLFVESGDDPEKAVLHAMVSEGMKTYRQMGNQMIRSIGPKDSKNSST